MPIRVYECPDCWFRTERIEYSPGAPPICPRCDEEVDRVVEMQKVITSASPHFKGSGWCRPSTYVTPPQRGPQ